MTILSNKQNANGGTTEVRNSIGIVLLSSEEKNNSSPISAAAVVWGFKIRGSTTVNGSPSSMQRKEIRQRAGGGRRSRVEATDSYWIGPLKDWAAYNAQAHIPSTQYYMARLYSLIDQIQIFVFELKKKKLKKRKEKTFNTYSKKNAIPNHNL